MDSNQVLEREYLGVRARILEIAATLDRIERAAGTCDDDRLKQLHAGIEILQKDQTARAEAVQLLFSRDYQENWREEFGV